MAKNHILPDEREAALYEALRFSRTRFKHFDAIIESLYQGEDLSRFFADRRIWKVDDSFKEHNTPVTDRSLLRDIFVHLSRTTVIMANEYSILAVLRMFQYRHFWINDLFTWKPVASRTTEQVEELATFLFCRYEVPRFMYKALYESTTLHMLWFAQLANGCSPVNLEKIPVVLTRKMGGYFLKASDRFGISEALRWAQAKGLGANDQLAARIARSWIATSEYEEVDFWEPFIRLAATSSFDSTRIGEIIDYLREMKRQDGTYNFKGRTIHSLIRHSDEWHRNFSTSKHKLVWRKSGIDEFKAEGKVHYVVIREITNSDVLSREGQEMHHCVGSYAYYCEKGKSAIFSMRKYAGAEWLETMATIEVNLPLRRIVQAKAKRNATVSDEAKKILTAWASREGLDIGEYL